MSTTPKTTARDAPQRPELPLVLREIGMTPEAVRVAAFRSRIRYEAAQAKAKANTATT